MYTIIEIPKFTELAEKLITQEEHDILTATLLNDPEIGDLIPGAGGVRKLRLALGNRGKSSGARVIYFFVNKYGEIHLIFIYPKNKQANISAEDKKIFRQIAKELSK